MWLARRDLETVTHRSPLHYADLSIEISRIVIRTDAPLIAEDVVSANHQKGGSLHVL